MTESVFTLALEQIKHMKSEEGHILTKPFLDTCKRLLPLIGNAYMPDNFGSAMSCVKDDVVCNIGRLESKYSSNPEAYRNLYSITREEAKAKITRRSSSCTNSFVWLTRSMDFVVYLFRNFLDHPDWSMAHACTDSYKKSLKKWHGWLATSTFSVIIKLVPDRKKFMDSIGGTGDLKIEIEQFCLAFGPILEENHKFFAIMGVDDIKSP